MAGNGSREQVAFTTRVLENINSRLTMLRGLDSLAETESEAVNNFIEESLALGVRLTVITRATDVPA